MARIVQWIDNGCRTHARCWIVGCSDCGERYEEHITSPAYLIEVGEQALAKHVCDPAERERLHP